MLNGFYMLVGCFLVCACPFVFFGFCVCRSDVCLGLFVCRCCSQNFEFQERTEAIGCFVVVCVMYVCCCCGVYLMFVLFLLAWCLSFYCVLLLVLFLGCFKCVFVFDVFYTRIVCFSVCACLFDCFLISVFVGVVVSWLVRLSVLFPEL